MNKTEIRAWLKEHQDERGIASWKKRGEDASGLTTYGIGLVKLRKFAKQIGRDAKLAKSLWRSRVHEERILSLLVDDPRTMTVEQVEAQVEDLEGGYLAHVFSSCDATLAKAPFVVDLMEEWVVSEDETRRSCGHGLLYEISKWKKKTAPSEADFLRHVARISKSWKKESTDVLMAMAGALMGIGMRTKKLNAAALKVSRAIGPIEFDPDGKCDPFDVTKHLTKKFVQDRLKA